MSVAALPPESTRDDLLDLARECAAYVVERNPYVRLVAVSGSLTRAEHEGEHEDIDYFVVTARGRIWEAFLGCLWHGWRFTRGRGLPRTFFCFNYLVDETQTQEIDLRRREYVREFLNLRVLHGLDVYAALLRRYESRLRGVEPVLYGDVRRRTETLLAAESGIERPETPTALRAVYRVAAPFFRVVAKRMEGRRRRAFPGGYVYSNARVIRSHFRRAWGDAAVDEDGLPAADAFSAIAPTYESDVVGSPANRHMRAAVQRELERLMRPGMRVLDLGAGAGTDAIWLAERGCKVLAVDVAPGMVEEARRRVEAAGYASRVEVRRLAIENLGTLLPEEARSFDLVLANFGALNLAGEPERWSAAIARLLTPGGCLVASVMNRWCLPELLAGLVRLRPGFALRRLRGEPVPVGGLPLDVALYGPGELVRRLAGRFEAVSVRGLCVLALPPTLERGTPSLATSRALAALDRVAGGWPVLRSLGDHFLVVLRQRNGGRVLFDARAPVTASPVVDDVNEDGAMEVLLAADRLHLLDVGGRALQGWPRRAAKPIASTPAVVRGDDGVRIFAGSDDHHLHGFDLSGRRLPGFPYPTGGDVFSSPLPAGLDAIGRPKLVFGSDDGLVYAIDGAGRLRRGWPVRTGGYVSASPAVARTPDGPAVVIGSWDGRLYAVDAAGRALPGWPQRLGFPVWSSAAIADIDGDGAAEVVVAAHRLFAFRGDGSALDGFPLRLGGYAVGSPAIGDVDGDGRPEVVIASDRVYAVRADGSAVPGFPVDLGACVWASPLLVDVDGDGRAEIVVADLEGRVWALDGAGRVLIGWPRKAGSRIVAAPTAADLDHDGYLELLVATWDGRLVVYDTDARADDQVASPWRSFPRREAPDEPLCIASGPFEAPIEDAPPFDARLPNLSASFRMEPVRPVPYRITEVHIGLDGATDGVEAGLLYYSLDGRLHPSPLLGARGRYFGLIQPLPPLKQVGLHCELLLADGRTVRLPERGSYELRVGRAGLRSKDEVS